MNDRDRKHADRPVRRSVDDRPVGGTDTIMHLAIVALALGTAYIHSTLGSALYTLNAIGYLVGAAAIVVPFAIARRYRWLIRMGLAGYAATTIIAWALQGSFYTTAYVAKVIELALITLLIIDFARHDGNPIDRVRHELQSLFGRPQGPAAGRP